MRMQVCLMFFLVCTLSSYALDWQACLTYKFPNAPAGAWVLQDDSDGKGPYIKEWKLAAPKPTKEDLEAVEAIAVPWYQNRIKEKKADFDNWSNEELRALVKVLLDELNILRQKTGLPAKTADDLKQALKTKM